MTKVFIIQYKQYKSDASEWFIMFIEQWEQYEVERGVTYAFIFEVDKSK